MTQRRIVDGDADAMEANLLRAAKAYRVSEKTRERTLAAIAADASPSSGWSTRAKLFSSIVSVGIIAGLLAWTSIRSQTHTAPTSPAVSIAAVSDHANGAPTKAAASTSVDELPSLPVGALPSVTAAKSAPSPGASAPDDAEELAAELAGLDRVKREIEQGNAKNALALLDAHDARFRKGRLVPEATVLRIQALLSAGDRAGAKKLAEQFLAQHPKSPLAGRVHTMVDGDTR